MPDLPKEYVFAVDLYWWAFLLTGREEQSVSMVIELLKSLDDISALGLECTRSQLRKTIAKRAIAAVPRYSLVPPVSPVLPSSTTAFSCSAEIDSGDGVSTKELTAALLRLEILPRQVLLLTVFEGDSLTEAAGLLGCDVSYIAETRVTALCNLTAMLTLPHHFPVSL